MSSLNFSRVAKLATREKLRELISRDRDILEDYNKIKGMRHMVKLSSGTEPLSCP